MKRLVFTVTNELNYDQRMIRICNSLHNAGYEITLIGVKHHSSPPLFHKSYHQIRINTYFKKGFGFYAEYNIRLFFKLLFLKADLFCCIDLDTILPVYFAGKWRHKKIVYDAHEYFSQLKEVVTRKYVYKVWHSIEKVFVPKFKNGYTVGYQIASEFKKWYGIDYEVIRNAPILTDSNSFVKESRDKTILYQGAVNHARGLEYLIPAMKQIDASLYIYGDGNFLKETHLLIIKNKLQDKVILKGKSDPESLKMITKGAYIGINLVENNGLNQYYSLANKFFDYIHAGVPQVSMNYPEYKKINEQFEVALLIDDLSENTVSIAINKLLNNKDFYESLQSNCLKAREVYHWQNEEKKLISFYKNILG